MLVICTYRQHTGGVAVCGPSWDIPSPPIALVVLTSSDICIPYNADSETSSSAQVFLLCGVSCVLQENQGTLVE